MSVKFGCFYFPVLHVFFSHRAFQQTSRATLYLPAVFFNKNAAAVETCHLTWADKRRTVQWDVGFFDLTACISPFGENSLLQAPSKILPEIEQADGKDAHQCMSIINHLFCYLCTIYRFFLDSWDSFNQPYLWTPHQCLPQSSVLSWTNLEKTYPSSGFAMHGIYPHKWSENMWSFGFLWPRWIIAWQ